MKKEVANYPWVFWLSVRWRPRWFKKFWGTRGANYAEYQFLWWQISIGKPWLKMFVDSSQRDYGSAKYVHKSNQENLKQTFSFLIKRNNPLKAHAHK